MQQYSLCLDDDTTPTGALLVREPDGAVRPAQRAEILAVARELVTVDELRGEDLSQPEKAKAFLRLRLTALEHEVCGLLLLDNRLRLIDYLEPFRGTLSQAAVYPREVVKLALRHNAGALMMVHYVARNIMGVMCPVFLCGRALETWHTAMVSKHWLGT
ncbi:MAG: DNA repair protein RadC [Variovorax sp.]|nr:DNA repair protein RadC [Variovorax sp.]MBN9478549.1 DNA repair protein RadC [Burkholderiales bacterium]